MIDVIIITIATCLSIFIGVLAVVIAYWAIGEREIKKEIKVKRCSSNYNAK